MHQCIGNRLYTSPDQRRPVIKGVDPHILRQTRQDLWNGFLDLVHHHLGVLAFQHDRHACHGLPLPIARHGSLACLRSCLDRSHVLQVDGRAVLCFEDDVLHVRDRFNETETAHVGLFPSLDDEVAPCVRVVVLESLEDFLKGDPVFQETVGVHEHVVLFYETAKTVHLVDTGHGPQLRRDDPILNRAKLHR